MAETLNADTVLGTADVNYTFTRNFDTDPAMETLLVQQLWKDSSLTSGTGTYVPFLNQNATGQDVASQGFNTDDGAAKANNNGAGLDMSNTSSTRAIQLKDIPVVIGVDGQAYYEIRLDINEENNNNLDAGGLSNRLLALSEFQLYWSDGQAELADFNSATYETRAFDEADGFHLAFDLDANEDRMIQLRDSNPGGGKDDYVFFIPVSAFSGVDPLANITLFSQFGPSPAEGATPEEWRIRTTTSIDGEKFNDYDGDGVKDPNETSTVGISGVTIKIYQDSTTTGVIGQLDGTDALVTSVLTDANGHFAFYGLLPGTYFIDEVVPAGWSQTSGDYETVIITTPGEDVTGVQIGNFLPDPKMALTKVITSVTDGVTAAGAASSAPTAGVDEAGDIIYYTITLTNTGNVALTNINLTDVLEGTGLPGPTGFTIGAATESGTANSVLDVGESWTWLASYTVQANDIATNGGTALPAVGQITNTADATAKFGDTTVNVPEQTVNTPIYIPSMALTKVITSVTDGVTAAGAASSAATAGVDEAGDIIYYTITLTNTGNVALTNINLTDVLEGTGLPGPTGFTIGAATESGTANSVLDVGESWTWLASYTVQANDIATNGGTALPAVGQITNTADATAKFGDTTVNVPEQTVNTPIYVPGFNVDKAVTSVTGGYLDGSTWIVNSVGDKINYTITVTNTGNVALTKNSIVDTLEATIGFPLTGPSGDNGVVNTLEVGEVWTFTTEYTVTAADFALADDDIDNKIEAKFNFGTTVLTDDDTVATPIAKVDLEKGVSTAANGPYADADTAPGAAVGVAQDMYFQITVTNTGAVDLDNVTIWDVSTAHGNAINYLYQNNALTAFAGSLGATIDKADGDNVLSVGETWTIKYVEDFEYGQHVNTGYVTNDQGATDNDAAHYIGKMVGPGVRTPGFWTNLGSQFWDGNTGNQTKTGPDFPSKELLYAVDSDGPNDGNTTKDTIQFDSKGVISNPTVTGLLVGDWNMNGITDNLGLDKIAGTADDLQEDTLFISYTDARNLINASNKHLTGNSGDGVVMLGRDVVATWLNYLAGNPIDQAGPGDDGYSPQHFLQDAVNWLQTWGGTDSDGASDIFDIYKGSHAVVKTSDAAWTASMGHSADRVHTAALAHSELDFYNNTGAVHDDLGLLQQYANPDG